MKKIISVIMVVVMILSLAACGNNKEAFEASKVAFDEINGAYQIIEQIGSDIYEAWRLAIYEDDRVLTEGVNFLDSKLHLTADELAYGYAVAIVESVTEGMWEVAPEESQNELVEAAKSPAAYRLAEDELFTYCVNTVVYAYKYNGKMDEAEQHLESAKTKMKELSQDFSDYEHYPNLKGFYSTTNSFFSFCQEPTGSFEQVKETLNDYKNEARDYISDLDYIFEE